MKYYLIAIFCALIMSSAISNLKAPVYMPVSIGNVKPSSLGLIRDEGGIGEIHVTDSARTWRYATEITTKHPAREADFPTFGNN
jgi:hypothetical protein